MRKRVIILLAVVMVCICGVAAAEYYPVLGKPFPDFRTTDDDRNEFSLSGALADHEAVLINLWASWCGPCIREFPFLNEVYEQYGDRVAFIGMTVEPDDNWNLLWTMKKQYHIAYPVAKEEGTGILDFIGGRNGTPVTIIVDRFGNTVYMQIGAFADSAQLSRLLDVFLGDGYTDSAVLTEIPLPADVPALPVSSSRSLRVENEDARHILLRLQYVDPEQDTVFGEETAEGWVIPGDTARLVMEPAAGDNLLDIVFMDYGHEVTRELFSLLDSGRNEYTYELSLKKPPMGDPWFWVSLGTKTGNLDLDPDYIELCLFPDEESIREMADYYSEDHVNIIWEYTEKTVPETVRKEADILHAVDQFGKPVPGVIVLFCTDLTCSQAVSDESGVITFAGEPENYHVQILKVPEGYSFDPAFELQTGAGFGEWVLVVRRN